MDWMDGWMDPSQTVSPIRAPAVLKTYKKGFSSSDLLIETLALPLFEYVPSIFELNHQVIFRLNALNTRRDMNKNNFIPTNITLHDVFCTMS